MADVNRLNVVVFVLNCEGDLGSCDVVLQSVGFSTSRLHTVHIVLSDNGCDKCICSLSESSNVISVVKRSPVKNPLYTKVYEKPEK